jgi:hypothetical protein
MREGVTDRARTVSGLLPPGAHGPVWSPDGRVAFASNRLGGIDMYATRGVDVEGDLLLVSATDKRPHFPTDWSSDGRYLLYQRGPRPVDLWVLPMSPPGPPRPFVASPSDEQQGRFSPDVRAIAYTSNESGTPEVYLRRFPEADGKWRVSTQGGAQPRWGRDGKELFYLALNGQLMAAAVKTGTSRLETAVPRALFQTGVTEDLLGHVHYAVSRDGQRFLVNLSADEDHGAPITVVLNWQARLRSRQ